MSGRAYARTAAGGQGGKATDIDAWLTHRFRIQAPKCSSKAKELAIRSAIKRRCVEKNWKKMITLRHMRLSPPQEEPMTPAETTEDATTAPATETTGTTVEPMKSEEATDATATDPVAADPATAETAAEDATKGEAENEQKEDAMAEATAPFSASTEGAAEAATPAQRLEELRARLQTLSEAKHSKFTLLKEMLVAEARRKAMSGGTGVGAKRKRVEFQNGQYAVSPRGMMPCTAMPMGPMSMQQPTVMGPMGMQPMPMGMMMAPVMAVQAHAGAVMHPTAGPVETPAQAQVPVAAPMAAPGAETSAVETSTARQTTAPTTAIDGAAASMPTAPHA